MSKPPVKQTNIILEELRKYTYHFSNEKELQEAIYIVLEDLKDCIGEVKREKELPSGIIDFYVIQHKIGIEVKIQGSDLEITRQLEKYINEEEIDSIILVTSKWAYNLPKTLSGKPITVLWIPNF